MLSLVLDTTEMVSSRPIIRKVAFPKALSQKTISSAPSNGASLGFPCWGLGCRQHPVVQGLGLVDAP